MRDRRPTALLALSFLAVVGLFGAQALAQRSLGDIEQRVEVQQQAQIYGLGNRWQAEQQDYEEPQASEEYMQKKAAADYQFEGIMQMNAPASESLPAAKLSQQPPSGWVAPTSGGAASQPTENPVEVPLKAFEQLRSRLLDIQKELSRRRAPAVVLGAAEYSGQARKGVLELKLKLQVTLGQPDRWKFVPLVGSDAVLAGARVAGRPIPTTSQGGYHVWITRDTGELTIEADLLVPSRGPRGSIEFDFQVARTPVTDFSCRFPVKGLEPRIDAAVQSQARTEGDHTLVKATLQPTTRIHLIGFRELGEAEGQPAKVYAESLHLMSVDEGALDVFSVVRYTILYAGAKEFNLFIPAGMEVVAADGEGAFRFTLDEVEGGKLLRGETAFPIRNNYEISLRLHRELAKGGESFTAPLPRGQGVEREHGWLGVEVPGKLRLEEISRQEALAVDVRQLPPEMINSAVSPILKAYRFHSPKAEVRLSAVRLPEKEPAGGSVDRVRAISQVSAEGHRQTDMKITLRNRLRHSLNLKLPEGMTVLSATLDGQPVKPSRDESGNIILPLKRSAGGERLKPFTLQLSLEERAREPQPFGWFGRREMQLPALDLPVSSLVWEVFLPANNVYSRLKGDFEAQAASGSASWHQAPSRPTVPGGSGGLGLQRQMMATGEETESGAMPVRLSVEERGKTLGYTRYWLEAGHQVKISFWFLRGWLRYPLWLLGMAAMALALALIGERRRPDGGREKWWLGLALAALDVWPLWRIGGGWSLVLAASVGLLLIGMRRCFFGRLLPQVVEWGKTLWPRFKERPRSEKPHGAVWVLWKMALGAAVVVMGLYLLGAALHLVFRLFFLPTVPGAMF